MTHAPTAATRRESRQKFRLPLASGCCYNQTAREGRTRRVDNLAGTVETGTFTGTSPLRSRKVSLASASARVQSRPRTVLFRYGASLRFGVNGRTAWGLRL